MPSTNIRRSQAVVPFGVGAMVDFPEQCLMAAGLDAWPDEPRCIIRDERLARRLGVQHFRLPPPQPRDASGGNYLPFVRFPLWHFCPRCRAMTAAAWNDPAGPKCASPIVPRFKGEACVALPAKRRWRMVPVRFVVACPNGHIDDFPWLLWAHSRPGQMLTEVSPCPSPHLRFNYTGKTGLIGLLVQCETCGKKRSMMGSAGAGALKGLMCSGTRPWLGPDGSEACSCDDKLLRVLQRGASNIYFAKVASSILIPPFASPVRQIVDDDLYWSKLTSGISAQGGIDEVRLQILAEAWSLDFLQLKKAVEQKLAGVGAETGTQNEEDYRHDEYQALCGPGGSPEEGLLLRPQETSRYEPSVRDYFERIILVEKLTETRALTGFSRINPPPYREFDQRDQEQISLQSRPWLPAMRVYGEGLFLVVRDAAIKAWSSDSVRTRAGTIEQNHRQVMVQLNRQPRSIPPVFLLLHTLAHVLIRRLSFECGYGSSALRERIYCQESGDRRMSGILIYTAAGDCEGTMGGLVRQGKPGRFEEVLQGALQEASWCSSDPLCIESHGQGTDSLNLAACHACSLLPETSCEEGNRFLDRGMLVGTPDRPETGFFADLVSQILG